MESIDETNAHWRGFTKNAEKKLENEDKSAQWQLKQEAEWHAKVFEVVDWPGKKRNWIFWLRDCSLSQIGTS